MFLDFCQKSFRWYNPNWLLFAHGQNFPYFLRHFFEKFQKFRQKLTKNKLKTVVHPFLLCLKELTEGYCGGFLEKFNISVRTPPKSFGLMFSTLHATCPRKLHERVFSTVQNCLPCLTDSSKKLFITLCPNSTLRVWNFILCSFSQNFRSF